MGRTPGGLRRLRTSLGHNLASLLLVVLIPGAIIGSVIWLWVLPRKSQFIGYAADVRVLAWVPWVAGAVAALWLLGLLIVQRTTRPADAGRGKRITSTSLAALLALAVAAPLAWGGWTAWVTKNAISTVAKGENTATAPSIDTKLANPWGTRRRVNIMLLGGDGGVGRTGIRTDTVIVVSLDVRTGKAVSFSLPRNLMRVPFPPGSKLAAAYPYGYRSNDGEAGNSMLNAIYGFVPIEAADSMEPSDNQGADALKLAVQGALGIPIDYYVLVNLNGFEKIVDAMGGITVNINRPIPINGDTDRGIPPTGYLQPGPNQRLNGFKALWYARGRWGLSDYDRMERQRCALAAMVDEADPMNLVLRYTSLANAAKKIMRTDVPQELLPALAQVGLKMKDHKLRSVLFQHTSSFDPNNPDFDYMHAKVQRALHPPARQPSASSSPSSSASGPSSSPSPSASPSESEDASTPDDACAYHPVDGGATAAP